MYSMVVYSLGVVELVSGPLLGGMKVCFTW